MRPIRRPQLGSVIWAEREDANGFRRAAKDKKREKLYIYHFGRDECTLFPALLG
ncbi:MAG: hypothetical protein L0Z62_26125 [Gemmataceae bacterium]|nr:hypothetical protein [Gemmataceae bacterium]